jgi:hypothetical protein
MNRFIKITSKLCRRRDLNQISALKIFNRYWKIAKKFGKEYFDLALKLAEAERVPLVLSRMATPEDLVKALRIYYQRKLRGETCKR